MGKTPESATRLQWANRQKLRQWLTEWEIDCALREGETKEEDTTSSPSPANYAASPAVHDGDILLYRPVPPAAGQPAERPLYVLAVAEAENDTSLWHIPFSRFSAPAVPSEWKTGLRTPALHVLCGWNARRPPPDRTPPAWRIKRLNASQRERFRQAVQPILRNEPVDRSTRTQAGPPLCHPADPRHTYLEDEKALLDAYFPTEKDESAEDSSRASIEWFPVAAGPKAAEAGAAYGRLVSVYRTTDPAVEVRLYALEDQKHRLQVRSPSGSAALDYDGGAVWAEDGATSTRLTNGTALITLSADTRLFLLVPPRGRSLPLSAATD